METDEKPTHVKGLEREVELMKLVASLTPADVLTAYSGKPGCMCGCNGSYRVTSANRELATKDRGYGYDDEDVSDRAVARILRKVQKGAEPGDFLTDAGCNLRLNGVHVADDLQYVHLKIRTGFHTNRIYAVYLTPNARRTLEAHVTETP